MNIKTTEARIRLRSCSSLGAQLLFFAPAADGFARDPEDALQPAQTVAFFIGGEDLFFFGLRVAPRLWIVAATTLAVVTPVTLFPLGVKPSCTILLLPQWAHFVTID
jgi:hypothetical protein